LATPDTKVNLQREKSTAELVAPVFAEIPVTPDERSSDISKNIGLIVEASQNPVLTLNEGGMTIEISIKTFYQGQLY
jgi:hypothetical protein